MSVLFLLGAAVAGYFVRSVAREVMAKFVLQDQLLAGFFPMSALVGVIAGVGVFLLLLRTARAVEFTDSVVTELRAVSWPNREETVGNATVVLGATIFFSFLLAVYDFSWAKLTEFFLYSPG